MDQAAYDNPALAWVIWLLRPTQRRVAGALAVASPLQSEETVAAVGSSARAGARTLLASADVMRDGDGPPLTDPLFEVWLAERELTPGAGDDADT